MTLEDGGNYPFYVDRVNDCTRRCADDVDEKMVIARWDSCLDRFDGVEGLDKELFEGSSRKFVNETDGTSEDTRRPVRLLVVGEG